MSAIELAIVCIIIQSSVVYSLFIGKVDQPTKKYKSKGVRYA